MICQEEMQIGKVKQIIWGNMIIKYLLLMMDSINLAMA